jgi:chemotaxis signal transduction protein
MLDAQHESLVETGALARHTHLLGRVGHYTVAIPIGVVISIHEAPLVFPVPCAQPGIAGAIRFAGIAVPVFDLRRSLRLEPKNIAASDRLVLLDAGMRIMALIVDEVLEFVSIDHVTEEGLHALFGDTPVNANVIAGIACAPDLCAVIDPAGVLVPDMWDAETVRRAYEGVADPGHPLLARTAALAEIPKAATAVGIEAAVFTVAGQRFGAPLPSVVEFFNQASHAPIPVRTNIAVSLLNRRGEPVMLFDPRPILGLSPAPLPELVDGLVLSGERSVMAIPVDKLEGLELLDRTEGGLRPGRFCLSVHPSAAGAILLIDVPAFLHHAQSAFGNRAPAADAVA